MRYFTFLIAYRSDTELIPEQASVFAIITQNRFSFTLALDSQPYYFKPRLIYVVPVQKAWITPKNILTRITRNALKCGVNVNNRSIRFIAACNQNGINAGLNSAIPQADSLVRVLYQRQVFGHQ